ncbi:MAG: alpha/beta hydrolase [Chitinophagaceae bacterium]
MSSERLKRIVMERHHLFSRFLGRNVFLDIFLPFNVDDPSKLDLLLINDGQDLKTMGYAKIVDDLMNTDKIFPFVSVGIEAGKDRKNEYGTAGKTDFAGRGAKADAYKNFILNELIPFIQAKYHIPKFRSMSFAGFSLGGLSALDISWSHPDLFSIVGVFSGSLWWRERDIDDDYDDALHRIMHQRIRNGLFSEGMRFFFQAGQLDETADRNHNGIIDSIDDTLDMIDELVKKGYDGNLDIVYLEYADGKHNVETWSRAMPEFLRFAFGNMSTQL